MREIIIDFDRKESLLLDLVGGKAKMLTQMKLNGTNIPDFFCLSSHFNIKTINTPIYKKNIELRFEKLLNKYGSVIVRSSANFEDSETSAFPGVFLSKGQINTFDDLEKAIISVQLSKFSKTVSYYCRFKNIDQDKLKLAVIIQGEIKPDFSGVLFTNPPLKITNIINEEYYIEISKGYSEKILTGAEMGLAYIISKTNYKPLNNNFTPPKLLLKKLWSTSKEIKSFFEIELDIEWAYCNKELYILQARPLIKNQPKLIQSIKNTPKIKFTKNVLPNERMFGLKGSAMEFFIKNNLFNVPIVIIYPHSNIELINKKLSQLNNIHKGITIRYSYKDVIGLPRFFAKNINEAIKIILESWQQEWLIIVHEYFIVKNSFELYLEKDGFLVEHIPGMWESESTLEPDVILNEKGNVTFMKYMKAREAKYVSYKTISKILSPPCTKTQLRSWYKKNS